MTTQLYAPAIRRGGHASAERLEAFYDRPAPAAPAAPAARAAPAAPAAPAATDEA